MSTSTILDHRLTHPVLHARYMLRRLTCIVTDPQLPEDLRQLAWETLTAALDQELATLDPSAPPVTADLETAIQAEYRAAYGHAPDARAFDFSD